MISTVLLLLSVFAIAAAVSAWASYFPEHAA
jgi:hypothetical protein